MKKTELEEDYPYLTKELAQILGKNPMFVAKAANVLGMKGDPRYHQAIRASRRSHIQRYSVAARTKLEQILRGNPGFNPYRFRGDAA
jgi:hypothetical protein